MKHKQEIKDEINEFLTDEKTKEFLKIISEQPKLTSTQSIDERIDKILSIEQAAEFKILLNK